MFQFHTGSIKSYRIDYYQNQFRQFQFHTGSIKSVSKIISLFPFLGFNSILVRLKEKGTYRAYSVKR